MSYHWWSNPHAYERKARSKRPLELGITLKHPLTESAPAFVKVRSPSIDDPLTLSMMTDLSELDPLTRMAAVDEQILLVGGKIRGGRDTFEPWGVKKAAILSKFTTQEKLSIMTSSFANEEVSGVSEKVLHRLEQLDLDSGLKQYFGGLSQEEYTFKINQFHQQLTEAWQSDMRVNALKIAIQCCKLLGDTAIIPFYPSKFVIITDILDKFGHMVYDRLKGKISEALPPEVAKETCKNWFFKVGSIRELLPRLCIELAILKSYCFINPNPEYGRILIRLLNSMWGIGDPVVAIYLRCYLCRVAMDLVPNDRDLFMKCFQDLLLLHDQVLENFRNSPQLVEEKVTMETYMRVLSPAIDWILQCLVHRGEHLNYTLQSVSNAPPFWKSVLLSSVLATVSPSFVAEECTSIIEMILTLEANLGEILKNLGLCLIIVQHPGAQPKEIWSKIWPVIRKIQNRDAYLDCSAVWVEFVVKNFGTDVINSFLDDIMNHVSIRSVEKSQVQGRLANIVEKLLMFSGDITQLLKMNKFVKMVALLPPANVKGVFTAFNTKHVQTSLGDNVVISTLMHFATVLHDSVDALTPVDEVRQIGGLINGFILKVNYGRNYEKQLEFYDEARGAFTNIDAVLVQLVQCVCRLGMEVGAIVGGHHTKRTRGFLSACIAYAFITIPSLENVHTHLQLYHLTAQVAYANQCVSQGDSCLKAAINTLNENQGEFDCGETILVEFVCNLLGTLLAVPDHPKESTLYLLKALMTIPFSTNLVQLRCLSLLGAYAQEEYPYKFQNVETNSELYGGAEQFVTEIDSLAAGVLNDLLSNLKQLGDQRQAKTQAKLSLDVFWEIVSWGDLTNSRMFNLALNLWTLAKPNLDQTVEIRTIEAIRKRAVIKPEFLQLASKMQE